MGVVSGGAVRLTPQAARITEVLAAADALTLQQQQQQQHQQYTHYQQSQVSPSDAYLQGEIENSNNNNHNNSNNDDEGFAPRDEDDEGFTNGRTKTTNTNVGGIDRGLLLSGSGWVDGWSSASVEDTRLSDGSDEGDEEGEGVGGLGEGVEGSVSGLLDPCFIERTHRSSHIHGGVKGGSDGREDVVDTPRSPLGQPTNPLLERDQDQDQPWVNVYPSSPHGSPQGTPHDSTPAKALTDGLGNVSRVSLRGDSEMDSSAMYTAATTISVESSSPRSHTHFPMDTLDESRGSDDGAVKPMAPTRAPSLVITRKQRRKDASAEMKEIVMRATPGGVCEVIFTL